METFREIRERIKKYRSELEQVAQQQKENEIKYEALSRQLMRAQNDLLWYIQPLDEEE